MSASIAPWPAIGALLAGLFRGDAPGYMWALLGHVIAVIAVGASGFTVGGIQRQIAGWSSPVGRWLAMMGMALLWGASTAGFGFATSSVMMSLFSSGLPQFPDVVITALASAMGAMIAGVQVAWFGPSYRERRSAGRARRSMFTAVAFAALLLGPLSLFYTLQLVVLLLS
ncbi:MAG: hypothetical protein AAGA48_36485 [Myxococcota bacterium]